MRFSSRTCLTLAVTLHISTSSCCFANVIINEIARKGTSNACIGHDWIELCNSGSDAIELSSGNCILHDNKGMNDLDAFHFSAGTALEPNACLILCAKVTSDPTETLVELPDPTSPQFGIGSDDAIALVRVSDDFITNDLTSAATQSRDIACEIVSTVGPLPDTDDASDVTHACDWAAGDCQHTSTPTPGQANVIAELKTHEERVAEHKARLAEQDALGTAFFNVDSRGLPVENGMDEALDLHIAMTEEDHQCTMKNASHELCRPFQSMKVSTLQGDEIASFASPGRIRPKGQTSLCISQCLGTDTIPFQIDMDHSDNPTQTLFGVGRFHLRHHMSDNSHMRDWACHRMLARFGLAHLRARTVRLFLNGQDKPTGLYALMEAPDNEFVFARNFPTHTPDSFALHKVTNLGVDCGECSAEQIANATARLSETSTPPYAFERGEHQRPVETLGVLGVEECIDNYMYDTEVQDKEDVVLAWLRYNQDCATMRIEEGLMDRDLGTSDWDGVMEGFLRKHLDESKGSCDPLCANSDLAEDVDVDNFLKTMAFYAVTLNQDSPLGNGNNYYLVQSGDGLGWKLQAYDFNFAFAAGCQEEVCNERLVHWSIVRPTCEALEDNPLVGPLLTDPTFQSQYLDHVKEFVDTVYSNSSLVDQMTAHISAIQGFASQDIFSTFGIYLQDELSPDANGWDTGNFPLLPLMKARSADVKAQLQAIEDGVFARGPLVAPTDNDPWEVCADWRTTEPETSRCEQGCQYDGCHMDGWTIASYCDEQSGICYHGDYDEACHNIVDGEQYPGMDNRIDGRRTFCRFAQGLPVKASACPALGSGTIVSVITGEGSSTRGSDSSGAWSTRSSSWTALAMFASSVLVMMD